jgi:predicted class III extradiol MEMO1 family dioxygenase
MKKVNMNKANDIKTKEWLELLKALKQRVTEKDLFFKRTVFENSKLNFQWSNFLISKNILIKDENELYKWNEKIPVTIKIVKAYQEYSKELRNKQKTKSKMKSIPISMLKDVRQKQEVKKKLQKEVLKHIKNYDDLDVLPISDFLEKRILEERKKKTKKMMKKLKPVSIEYIQKTLEILEAKNPWNELAEKSKQMMK